MQSLGPIISRLDHAYRADEYDKMMAAKLIFSLFAGQARKDIWGKLRPAINGTSSSYCIATSIWTSFAPSFTPYHIIDISKSNWL